MLKQSLAVETYVSDLGLSFENVRFSQKAGMECGIPYVPPKKNPCPPPRYFKMRRLKAVFSGAKDTRKNGVVVEYPVPTLTLLYAYVEALVACGALCIDLIGEEWSLIPPSLSKTVKYTPTYDLVQLPEIKKAHKVTGRMSEYVSDAGINGKPKFAIEYLPSEFSEIALGKLAYDVATDSYFPEDANNTPCLGKVEKSSICVIGEQNPRRLIVRGNSVSEDQAALEKQDIRIWSRSIPLKSRELIPDCVEKLGAYKGVQCIGYKGETIKNLHLLIAFGGSGAITPANP